VFQNHHQWSLPPTIQACMLEDLTLKSGLEPYKKRNKNVVAELNIYFYLFIIEFNQLPVVRQLDA